MTDIGETALPPSYDGSVVVDIGGDAGTLVVYTPKSMAGEEIDIRAIGEDRPHSHTSVRERRLQHSSLYAAVFPALPAGHYTFDSGQEVAVTGGRVTEVHLRQAQTGDSLVGDVSTKVLVCLSGSTAMA